MSPAPFERHPWVDGPPCNNYPPWQGCECEREVNHNGPHECVCGAQWDDDGRRAPEIPPRQ